MARLSLVSDSPEMSRLLREALGRLGHQVAIAPWSETALAKVGRLRPELVIAEFTSLTAGNPHAFRRAIARLGAQCNVLALYCHPNGNVADIVDMVGALLDQRQGPRVVELRRDFGFLSVDVQRREAFVDDQQISLTPTEAHILCILADNVGRCVTAGELVAEVQGYQTNAQEARDIIRVHICNLRRKLMHASSGAPQILSVRGKGYLLKGTSAPVPAARTAYASGP
jgi:DNA-binding response OmpR family regulator